MFSFFKTNEELLREVHVEVNYLTKLYGDDAGRIALEKAQRPRLRTLRRRVLQEAARQLARAEKRKRQLEADLAPMVPPTAVYAMDDDAHFRLSNPHDGWSRVEPAMAPAPAIMTDDDARFRLTGQEIVWSAVEPERVPAPPATTDDGLHNALSPRADGPGEPEPRTGSEPTPARVEIQHKASASASPDAPGAADPMPAPAESHAPVKRAKRMVRSRSTTFGIELEIDGVLIMFDARADAKVVSALVYALRDS